jgi:transcriptional regulator with XRE-family HTH domain
MSNALKVWLSKELEGRKWSQGELARQAGMSRAFVSRVLSGDASPSTNFCYKIAAALGESPEKVLRLAGILPTASDDPALAELRDLVENLPPSQRKQALDFLRFLYQKGETE